METDWATNVRRVSPFLGVLLVMVFGFYMAYMLYGKLNDFALELQPQDAVAVKGNLTLANGVAPTYGNYVSYVASISGDTVNTAHSYISTTCFQGEKLVFQAISKPSAKVFLTNPVDPSLTWDGNQALCTASLFYLIPQGSQANLYMLDSTSFTAGSKQ